MELFRPGYAFGTILFVVPATAMFLSANSMIAYLSTFLITAEKMSLRAGACGGVFPPALGVIGPVAGVLFAAAAPDHTGRAIEAVE